MALRRLIHLRALHALKPLGLGPKQAAILRRMGLEPGPRCLVDLSKATASDPAAVGRIVDGLIRKGWVQALAVGPKPDRRRRDVALSAKGAELAAKVQAVFLGMDRDMSAVLDPLERRQMNALLEKIAQTLA